MRKRPKRAKSARKHQRRQAEGWRKTQKLSAERDAEWRNVLGGAGWRPDPTQEVNHQELTGRFSTDDS